MRRFMRLAAGHGPSNQAPHPPWCCPPPVVIGSRRSRRALRTRGGQRIPGTRLCIRLHLLPFYTPPREEALSSMPPCCEVRPPPLLSVSPRLEPDRRLLLHIEHNLRARGPLSTHLNKLLRLFLDYASFGCSLSLSLSLVKIQTFQLVFVYK